MAKRKQGGLNRPFPGTESLPVNSRQISLPLRRYIVAMKYLMRFFVLVLLLAGASSCTDTPKEQEPSLIAREMQPPEEALLETQPPTDEGNFESMVSDYERKDRVIWQKPELVISLLGDLDGRTVADIGAGTGYFTFRIVPVAQKVIGVDIDPRFIAFMDSVKVRLPQEYRNRFESRLAKPDDPLLQPEEADAIMIVNTYGYLDNRPAYLKKLWAGMKPDGHLLIIDFKKNNLPVGPSEAYKVSHAQVKNELEQSGFQVFSIDRTSLDYQYIIQARKNPAQK
jgi:SAM-dependent methyltransferase